MASPPRLIRLAEILLWTIPVMVINIVNNFFYERLVSLPTIKDYMDTVQTSRH